MSLTLPLNLISGLQIQKFYQPILWLEGKRAGKWEAVVGIPPKSHSVLGKDWEGIRHNNPIVSQKQ